MTSARPQTAFRNCTRGRRGGRGRREEEEKEEEEENEKQEEEEEEKRKRKKRGRGEEDKRKRKRKRERKRKALAEPEKPHAHLAATALETQGLGMPAENSVAGRRARGEIIFASGVRANARRVKAAGGLDQIGIVGRKRRGGIACGCEVRSAQG